MAKTVTYDIKIGIGNKSTIRFDDVIDAATDKELSDLIKEWFYRNGDSNWRQDSGSENYENWGNFWNSTDSKAIITSAQKETFCQNLKTYLTGILNTTIIIDHWYFDEVETQITSETEIIIGEFEKLPSSYLITISRDITTSSTEGNAGIQSSSGVIEPFDTNVYKPISDWFSKNGKTPQTWIMETPTKGSGTIDKLYINAIDCGLKNPEKVTFCNNLVTYLKELLKTDVNITYQDNDMSTISTGKKTAATTTTTTETKTETTATPTKKEVSLPGTTNKDNNTFVYKKATSSVTNNTDKDLYDLTMAEFASLLSEEDQKAYKSLLSYPSSQSKTEPQTIQSNEAYGGIEYTEDTKLVSQELIYNLGEGKDTYISESTQKPLFEEYQGDMKKQLFEYKKEDLKDNKPVKTKIIIHHTLGWGNPQETANTFWLAGRPDKDGKDTPLKIAPSWIIGGSHTDCGEIDEAENGKIVRVYNDTVYWSMHSDFDSKTKGHQKSIAITLCNLGGLEQKSDTDYVNSLGGKYSGQKLGDTVYKLDSPFHTYTYFHKLTQKQIDQLGSLIMWLSKEYSIPIQKFENMTDSEIQNWFNGSADAKDDTKTGIFLHSQINSEMHDIPPQPELIAKLKTLGEISSNLEYIADSVRPEEGYLDENYVPKPEDEYIDTKTYITPPSSKTVANNPSKKHNQPFIDELNVKFKDKVIQLINFAFANGWDLHITNGFRNYKDTISIYGKFQYSHHQFGLAIDINLFVIKGSTQTTTATKIGQSTSRQTWRETGVPQYAEKIGLVWGGIPGYSYYDPVHFDYSKKYPIKKLKKLAVEKYGDDTVTANQQNIANKGNTIV